jgi:hypothetical protein
VSSAERHLDGREIDRAGEHSIDSSRHFAKIAAVRPRIVDQPEPAIEASSIAAV